MPYRLDYPKSRVVEYQLVYIFGLKKGVAERVGCIYLIAKACIIYSFWD